MFFYLAYFTMEAVFGVAWWTIKKTSEGVYYILYGKSGNEIQGKIKLSDKEIEYNKEVIQVIIKNNQTQQIEIKKLNEKIDILNNYINSLK